MSWDKDLVLKDLAESAERAQEARYHLDHCLSSLLSWCDTLLRIREFERLHGRPPEWGSRELASIKSQLNEEDE